MGFGLRPRVQDAGLLPGPRRALRNFWKSQTCWPLLFGESGTVSLFRLPRIQTSPCTVLRGGLACWGN